jgi:hypothetical protein
MKTNSKRRENRSIFMATLLDDSYYLQAHCGLHDLSADLRMWLRRGLNFCAEVDIEYQWQKSNDY